MKIFGLLVTLPLPHTQALQVWGGVEEGHKLPEIHSVFVVEMRQRDAAEAGHRIWQAREEGGNIAGDGGERLQVGAQAD